jgi:hypothetical protein
MSSVQSAKTQVCGKKLANHQSYHPLDVLFDQITKFSCADGLGEFGSDCYGKHRQLIAP